MTIKVIKEGTKDNNKYALSLRFIDPFQSDCVDCDIRHESNVILFGCMASRPIGLLSFHSTEMFCIVFFLIM